MNYRGKVIIEGRLKVDVCLSSKEVENLNIYRELIGSIVTVEGIGFLKRSECFKVRLMLCGLGKVEGGFF